MAFIRISLVVLAFAMSLMSSHGVPVDSESSNNTLSDLAGLKDLKESAAKVKKLNDDIAENAAMAYSASMKMIEDLRKANKISKIMNNKEFENITCRIKPKSPYLKTEVRATLRSVKLLEYIISVENYTDKTNPLVNNLTYMYKGNQWNRIAHSHGQTILNLAFNYGVLSLMTLSFGVAEMEVEVYEEPLGCLQPLSEDDKHRVVLDLLLRDFDPDGPLTVVDGQYICNQIIKDVSGSAKFTDQCCFAQWPTYEIVCIVDLNNKYLAILDILIAIVSLSVFLFGPLGFTGMFYARTLDTVKYIVKLKEPLYKTLRICKEATTTPLSKIITDRKILSDFTLDLRQQRTFSWVKNFGKILPSDKVLPIKISEYNILVNYLKLLPESEVPVGVSQSISRAIFFCKLNEVHAFQDCCEANVLGCFKQEKHIPWQKICNVIGRVLLVLFLPFAYYIRLVVYYLFEHPEVENRQEAAERLNMTVLFEYRLLPYLTPTHPLYIFIYIVYFSVGITTGVLSTFNTESKFQHVVIGALHDLINMSWIGTLEMIVKNILWPFQKLGVFGILLAPVYYLLLVPICAVVIVFYCIPLIFISCRLLTHALGISSLDERQEDVLPGEMKRMPTGVEMLETQQLVSAIQDKAWKRNRMNRQCKSMGAKECMINLVLALICITTLCAAMVLLSEVVTFLMQIVLFTMMGIIVNAGSVLKYGTLIFLVVLYSYDCYNNVYEQYLKLNKALFSEIKGRIKEIMEFTSLPSHLQENRGFKSQEASEQADYEESDNVSKENNLNWDINDLILFIDNDDVPRIPKKLFEEACQINVPGSPGPVYLSLIAATGKFLFIVVFLVFVFIVVMSFGDVYRLSSTNQMLATMAGGFMPMIFSNILKPKRPETELGTVSFKGKLEEVMINFYQTWPMYDLPFSLEEKEEEEEEGDSDSDSSKSDDKKEKGKDKGKDKDKGKGKDKDKGKDKKDSKGSLAEQEEELTQDRVHEMLSSLKTVRDAEGQYVDIVIIIPEEDENGMVEWGSIGTLTDIFGSRPRTPRSPLTPVDGLPSPAAQQMKKASDFFFFNEGPRNPSNPRPFNGNYLVMHTSPVHDVQT